MLLSSSNLNDDIAQLEQNKIPPGVAVSENVEDYENRPVVFSFTVYNQNQCEIANLQKPEVKKLMAELKKISKVLTKYLLHQTVSGIACKSISNSGNYSSLFTDLPPDADMLLQVDYSGPGRIFGYLVHNVFNIIAITKRHK